LRTEGLRKEILRPPKYRRQYKAAFGDFSFQFPTIVAAVMSYRHQWIPSTDFLEWPIFDLVVRFRFQNDRDLREFTLIKIVLHSIGHHTGLGLGRFPIAFV
jgi:hypothetical protein